MLDVGWYELLVIGVVALLVVGPKELPVMLRTIGRYVGVMRRHAAEFRDQFDQAMRESELDKVKQDLEKSTEQATSAIREAGNSLDRDLDLARRDGEPAMKDGAEVATANPADAAEVAAGASATGTQAKIELPADAQPTATSIAEAAARAAARISDEAAAAASAASDALANAAKASAAAPHGVNGNHGAKALNGAAGVHAAAEAGPGPAAKT